MVAGRELGAAGTGAGPPHRRGHLGPDAGPLPFRAALGTRGISLAPLNPRPIDNVFGVEQAQSAYNRSMRFVVLAPVLS